VGNRKQETITLKVDETFLEALKGVSNRSEFIRSAVLAALESTCPLCKGTGNLSPNQMAHWNAFATGHTLAECGDCNELRIVCKRMPDRPVHGNGSST
jgi:hypothetical protein